MTTVLFTEPGARLRPAGVKVIAWVFLGLAAYLLVNSVLIYVGVLSLASGSYVLGEYTTMGPILYVMVALALGVIATGLWLGWNWSRRLAVVAAGFFLATAIMSVSAAVIYFHPLAMIIHGAKIIGAIVAIRYLLLSDVVEYFTAKNARSAT